MFDHVKFGVRNYETSKAFYLAALAPLGVVAGPEGTPSDGIDARAGEHGAWAELHHSGEVYRPLPFDKHALCRNGRSGRR